MSLDFAALFALQAADVRRCQVCWALVHKDDVAPHVLWHRDQSEIHRLLTEAVGVPVPADPDPQERP